MATTKRQQELAKEIAEQMRREGCSEFNHKTCCQILGGKLKGTTGEAWSSEKAAILPLVQGRFRREKNRAANQAPKVRAIAPAAQTPHRMTIAQMVADANRLCRRRGDHLIVDL